MNLDQMGPAFPVECLRAALFVSLFSAWALVGLFLFLGRSVKQDYLRIWSGAWVFYAVWLTLTAGRTEPLAGAIGSLAAQACVALSTIFLLWGSLRCLQYPRVKRMIALLSAFVGAWIFIGPQLVEGRAPARLPIYILLGLSTPFAAVCLLRLRREKSFAGAGMLSLAVLLGVIYLGSNRGFFVAAGLQLFIAVAMVLILVHQMQFETEQMRAAMESARMEKELLLIKVSTAKDACQNLYSQICATEQKERTLVEAQKASEASTREEHLRAVGRMTGDVANDINNALSPITAYSDMLLGTLRNLPELPREKLERINKAAENVAQIVAHMREFYRPGSEMDASSKTQLHTTIQREVDAKVDSISEPKFPCRPLRILCIDDEPDLRELLHDVLVLDDHKVTVATGGAEGLDLFRAHQKAGEPYEVVITDLGMPDLDGREVARVIKAESPQTPVIMLTGWGAMMKVEGRETPEVDAVIGKPPRKNELSNLLSQVAAKTT